MAFRKKFEAVVDLQPDILVLQECEQQSKLSVALKNTSARDILWYGKNPHKGTAVISFRDIQIDMRKDHDPAYEFIIPYRVKTKQRSFDLYNIWAMPHQTDRKKDYVGQIYGALHHYSKALKKDSILIGDFNSNAIWDNKNKVGNHTDIVSILADQNIHSIYHHQHSIAHGKEADPTLYLLKNQEKPYHMDYCFASQSLITKKTKMEVGRYQDWIKLSDHMPVIVDHLK